MSLLYLMLSVFCVTLLGKTLGILVRSYAKHRDSQMTVTSLAWRYQMCVINLQQKKAKLAHHELKALVEKAQYTVLFFFFTLGWHLVVVVELVCLNDPESCAGGDFWSLAGLTMPDWSKGRGQTKSSPWSSRLGVGRWADNPLPEKRNLSPKTKLELPLRPIGKQGYRMLTPTTFHPSNCCHCTKCTAFTFAQK